MSDNSAEVGVPPVRASNEERDQAAGALRAAHAEGRLTNDEFEDRIAAAYAAKSRADLCDLLTDLPGALSAPVAGNRPPAADLPVLGLDAGPGTGTQVNWCLLVCLLCAFPPAGIVYLILASRHHPQPLGDTAVRPRRES